MLAGIVVHDCQPPVLPTAKLPIDGFVGLSRCTSTRPLAPPVAPEATRALNCDTAVVPKSTLLYCNRSPLPIPVTSWPPPVSEVVSRLVPTCPLYASAWIVEPAPVPPPVVF